MAELTMPRLALPLAALLISISSVAPWAEAADPPKLLWATQLANKKNCSGQAIALDLAGNAYVTGIYGNKGSQSIGTHIWHTSGGQVFLTRLNPDGKILWQKFAGGDGIDSGNAVATSGRNIFVAGYFSKTINFEKTELRAAKSKMRGYSPADGFVARFDPDGNLAWVRQFGGPASDQAYGVAADAHGNVYVSGYFQGQAAFGTIRLQSKSRPRLDRDRDEPDWNYGDIFVAKYDLHGDLVWVRQAGDSGNNVAYAIAVDPGGNAYVSGVAESGRITFGNITVGDKEERCFLAKYDANGNVLWAQSIAGDHHYHRYDKIAVDSLSNLFVGGVFSFTQHVGTATLDAAEGNLFLAKFRPDGALAWCKQDGGKSQTDCHALAVDAGGDCYVAGTFAEKATFGATQIHAAPHPQGVSGYDSFIIRYDGAGALVTAAQILHRNASIRGMAAGTDGSVQLTGNFFLPVVLGKTTFKTKTLYRENPTVLGEAVTDTFVARYQTHKP